MRIFVEDYLDKKSQTNILTKNTLDKLALGDDVLEGSRDALDIRLKI